MPTQFNTTYSISSGKSELWVQNLEYLVCLLEKLTGQEVPNIKSPFRGHAITNNYNLFYSSEKSSIKLTFDADFAQKHRDQILTTFCYMPHLFLTLNNDMQQPELFIHLDWDGHEERIHQEILNCARGGGTSLMRFPKVYVVTQGLHGSHEPELICETKSSYEAALLANNYLAKQEDSMEYIFKEQAALRKKLDLIMLLLSVAVIVVHVFSETAAITLAILALFAYTNAEVQYAAEGNQKLLKKLLNKQSQN